uniref:Uncharacterized protein n=1 Tax=Chelydra serpentina TaxID=8475 RepID=A0A8C3XIF8_CHESE
VGLRWHAASLNRSSLPGLGPRGKGKQGFGEEHRRGHAGLFEKAQPSPAYAMGRPCIFTLNHSVILFTQALCWNCKGVRCNARALIHGFSLLGFAILEGCIVTGDMPP